MRYRNKRIYTWSPSIAYATGLIASDGCLLSDGRHIDLTSKDIDQLENFCKAIGRDINITTKTSGKRDTYYRVQFSDVAFYDFLLGCGLTPNKSLSIGGLEMPERYYSHFLRGVFDGDGTTYGYYDLRWRSSFLYYVSFAGASLDFIKYLCDMNAKALNTLGRSITKGNRVFSLQYAKRDAYRLYRGMYLDAGDLFLARKRTKLEDFIKQDKNGTILQSLSASGVIR